jgi:hypothetical protein
MSGWRVAVREVYAAGGKALPSELYCSLQDIERARAKGAIKPAGGPCGSRIPPVELTRLGRDMCEERAAVAIPYKPSSTGGRAHGSRLQWRAAWLAALPRANEVRVSSCARESAEGSCFW